MGQLPDGTLAWQFNYHFKERTVPAADGPGSSYPLAKQFGYANGGWNHYWRENSNGFYKAQLNNAGPDGTKNIYELGDMAPLFDVGP